MSQATTRRERRCRLTLDAKPWDFEDAVWRFNALASITLADDAAGDWVAQVVEDERGVRSYGVEYRPLGAGSGPAPRGRARVSTDARSEIEDEAAEALAEVRARHADFLGQIDDIYRPGELANLAYHDLAEVLAVAERLAERMRLLDHVVAAARRHVARYWGEAEPPEWVGGMARALRDLDRFDREGGDGT